MEKIGALRQQKTLQQKEGTTPLNHLKTGVFTIFPLLLVKIIKKRQRRYFIIFSEFFVQKLTDFCDFYNFFPLIRDTLGGGHFFRPPLASSNFSKSLTASTSPPLVERHVNLHAKNWINGFRENHKQ